MKALTLWDPWATLVAHKFKYVETRIWATKYRGPLAIHAALRKPSFLGASAETQEFTAEIGACERELGSRFQFFPGHVLAIVNLVAIEPVERIRADLTARERIFGIYDDGRYAWFFENIRRLKTPVAVRGSRLLWEFQCVN